ncbi:b(0,+)-type amino acid transporter 1-like [Babylonia areolata]|uniref:b(0,+)-type amino acid transporter 1-like n=1 Tax=Babylonia areolata TaxID=304850 RepID=UPI003FD66A7B
MSAEESAAIAAAAGDAGAGGGSGGGGDGGDGKHSSPLLLAESPPNANGKDHADADDNGDPPEEGVRMQRSVGLVSGTTLIVGTIIGSGIFISPKGMMEGCGSVGLTLLLWVGCGALSTMGALVYAELGTAVPRSGGEHAYLLYTFTGGKKHIPRGGVGRVPSFLFDWIGLLIIRPTMFAVMSMALGTYAVKPFYPTCDPPPMAVKLVTAVAMCLIGVLNCVSVKVATSVQNVCTFTKVGALIIIAIGGIVELIKGNTENFEDIFGDTSNSAAKVAIAFYNGLWAFDGWNSLNFVTEELKNPSRNLPLAIMIGIPLVTLCYVLANIGYLAVMTKPEILQSHAVAVRWGEVVLGQYMTWLMPAFVIVSTFGSANGCLFTSGRLSYAAGREGHFPQFLGFISVDRRTPVPAIMFTVSLGICLIIPSDLGLLIDIFIFASWLFYGWTTLALLILRYTQPDLHRPYKVPIVVPILMLLACLYLLLAPIIQNPGGSGSFTLLLLALGIVAYVPFVHMNIRLPGMEQLTRLLQKIFCIVPTHQD